MDSSTSSWLDCEAVIAIALVAIVVWVDELAACLCGYSKCSLLLTQVRPRMIQHLTSIVQRTTSLLPSDPRKVRRRSSDLWGDSPARKQWPYSRREVEFCPGGTKHTCRWRGTHECQVYSMPVHSVAKAAHWSVSRSSSH